jgi:hypothetical protein
MESTGEQENLIAIIGYIYLQQIITQLKKYPRD